MIQKSNWWKIPLGCVLTITLAFSAASRAQASVSTFTDSSGDHLWGTANNWNPNSVPNGTQAQVPAGLTVDAQSTLPTPAQVYIGIGGTGSATWNMTAGKLAVTNGTFVGWDHVAQATISGGTLTDNSAGNGIEVTRNAGAAGSSLTANGSASVTATVLYVGYGGIGHATIGDNGSVNFNNINIGPTGNGSTLSVDGSNVTVKTAGLTLKNGAALNFTLDSSGISTITTNALNIDNTTPEVLNVDGTHFTGSGTFDLVKFTSLTGASSFGTVNLTGFAPNTATIVNNADSIQLHVSAAPSPASITMLGFASLLLWSSRASNARAQQ